MARDGVQAIEYLLNNDGDDNLRVRPQLILLDLKLPNIDGLERLRRIRADERTRLLPVVIFTPSSEEEDVIKSYDVSANSYVRSRLISSGSLKRPNKSACTDSF